MVGKTVNTSYFQESKNSHGGARKGSGRKKLPKLKRKQVVQIYEPGEVIAACGGLAKAKKIASEAIYTEALNNLHPES